VAASQTPFRNNFSATYTESVTSAIALRARKRVAFRILPFVFLLYVVAYIDRINVSFANLRMSAELGFSDRVYGFGVGVFFISYVLLEIPGAIIVERWSARKWIARIMISWGLVTMGTAFVRNPAQFYVARFLLGLAEGSFFPGMIVYLTHWFSAHDRGRAIACLYTAVPAASLVGAPVAGLLLGVNWLGLSGWRWLFLLEGIPAVAAGLVTITFLTDRPPQARWLPGDEREWLTTQLESELQSKKLQRDYSIKQAFCERRVLSILGAWVFLVLGSLANLYWVPTFLKRLSGASNRNITYMLMIPSLVGIASILCNGWHSDKTRERRWHTAIPLIIAGSSFLFVIAVQGHVSLSIAFLLLGCSAYYACLPVFWAIPTLILSETAAAASFGLINTFGQTGGLVGPYIIGFLNDRTHGLTASFAFIATAYFISASLVPSVGKENPGDPR
jgi:MFS transporter, ACS family, tartrate transporter